MQQKCNPRRRPVGYRAPSDSGHSIRVTSMPGASMPGASTPTGVRVCWRRKSSPETPTATAPYLRAVCDEADLRGYRFRRARLPARQPGIARIEVAEDQLRYELSHLLAKLKARDPGCHDRLRTPNLPDPHPSFVAVPGPVAPWERPDPVRRQDRGGWPAGSFPNHCSLPHHTVVCRATYCDYRNVSQQRYPSII